MAASLGGKTCEDPKTLARSCQASGIPTDLWFGKANGFELSPVGRDYGQGWLLLSYGSLKALHDQNADFDLVFTGTDAAHKYTLKSITILSAQAVSPGWTDDPAAPFLVKVADRRYHNFRVPIDRAFNVWKADGTDYLPETLNSGVAWTWQEVIDELAVEVGELAAEFILPFTPDGTPENLTFWGGTAWDALCDVLDRLACAPRYNIEDDEFTVVRLGEEDGAWVAMDAQFEERMWDAYPVDPVRAWRPEKCRVKFLRRPRPTDGSSPYYNVDVTLTATTGVVAGTYVHLDDDAAALGATGTPSNSAALATRAAERAADWLRKRSGFGRPILTVYRDFIPDILRDVPGATVGNVAIDDRGGPMRTEVMAKPDTILETWEPLSVLPPWFPDGPLTIEDEGTPLPRQLALNFIGSAVTAVDDPSNSRTNVTITGGDDATLTRVVSDGSLIVLTANAGYEDTYLEMRLVAGTYTISQAISTVVSSTGSAPGVQRSDWMATKLWNATAAAWIDLSYLWGAYSNSFDGLLTSNFVTASNSFLVTFGVDTTIRLYAAWVTNAGAGTGAAIFYNGSLYPIRIDAVKQCCTTTPMPAPIVVDIPGAFSTVVPAGAVSVRTHCWGGGAGGSGVASAGTTAAGGGGGAYARGDWRSVSAGDPLIGTVGAGGAGGTGASGSNGAATNANSSAIVAAGGTGPNGGTTAASTGTTKYAGGNASTGSAGNPGGGGGGGGSSAAGSAGSGTTAGFGGVGTYPGGAGGDGYALGNGSVGTAPGGGGGAGVATGGNGAAGRVLFEFA